MFSFLKFFNSKSDADKNKMANGRTLNLNGSEARAVNLYNTRPPVARKPTRSIHSSYSSDCKETVLSPGFSFRIAQRAREVRSTIPGTNSSNSYTLENTLNSTSTNTINGNNTSRDVFDKKRKLMETLDSFGVRKRTRLESGVDAIVNRRRRTISESNVPERATVMHECNYRPAQPTSTVTCLKTINLENKTKKHGDFESICQNSQKKPRTRNNEILSSYSSSKFLLKPGQKRHHQTEYDGESPKRKHCKSCTCCGSTILLEDNQNNLNKSDKTTETDHSDDLVTVAAGRIFNRSGKTQVVKKMCMKTILNEVLDDDDPTPYTSIEKVQEKKKKAQKNVILVDQCTEKSNIEDSNYSADLVTSVPSTVTYKFNGVKVAETGVLSNRSPAKSAPIATTTTTPLTCGVNSYESTAKINEENKSPSSVQLSFGSPKVFAKSPIESINTKTTEVDEKSIGTDQTPKSTNKLFAFQTPNSTVQITNNPPLQSPDKNENVSSKAVSSSFTLGSQTENSSKPSTFTFGAPRPLTNSTPLMQFGVTKSDNQISPTGNQSEKSQVDGEQSTPVMKFGSPNINDKPSTPTIQFGASKVDDLKSTPVLQFGGPKVDDVKSTSVVPFGISKADDLKSTPVLQFGGPKVDDVKSTPVVQFGTSKDDNIKSTPVMQFGTPKVDGKQLTPLIQFGVPKSDNQQSVPLQFGSNKESETSTSLFSFGNDTKSIENTKLVEPLKFQFGSQKSDNASSTESKNASFGSNSVQNPSLFSFGKTDPPKYDATVDKSTPKLQFGTLPTPVFGTSNPDQPKASVNQPIDNNGPKLMFGSQITDNKPATSSPGMLFANNTANPIFNFNSSNSKPNDKASDTPNSSFPFSSTKLPPTFGTATSQSFGGKSAFQFNSPKTEESKTQFPTPAFGSQSTTIAPFKFGDNKPASFGNTFPSSNQPIQFTNNPEKSPAEPFKFGSAVPSGTFQFNANKVESGPVKFGQNSNAFPAPGFTGFGNPAPQQTTSFGSVPPPQPSPFGNIASPSAVPAFGNATSPSSNAFGTTQNFQFGSTNNAPSTSSTFAFGNNSQSTKPDAAFNFNAPSKTASPFQFGHTAPALSTPQFGGTQTQGAFGFGSPPMGANGLPGSSQPLFSMGTAPVVERRKAKAVRRRQ